MSTGRVGAFALGAAGVGAGVVSVAIARKGPGYSFGGASGLSTAAALFTGCALVAGGFVARLWRPVSRFGGLLLAASLAWFLLDWNNPASGSSGAFTIGLLLYAACPAVVAHAAFEYPESRVRDRFERGLLLVAYADALVVLGLLPALVYDPAANGCSGCPRNLALVTDAGGVYRSLNRIGLALGILWGAAGVVLVVRRIAASGAARRWVTAPVLIPASLYLALVTADQVHAWRRGFLSNDGVDRRLWLGEAAALTALVLELVWTWLRARRERAAFARVVVEFGASPGPGLRDLLARTLGDPSLELAYRLRDGTLVDAHGEPAHLEGELTQLVRADGEVALLSHRPGLLDDPARTEEITVAARLAIENERLNAEALAQLDALRASRARVIAVGDAERRRLERDLHDGAQQRLVALSLALRLEWARLGTEPDPSAAAALHEAEDELRAALADLRALAHGIFPAVLAEEGLAAAIEALAEERSIRFTTLLRERLDPAVESAAYFVVSEAVRRSRGRRLTVSAAREDGRLLVDVGGATGDLDLVDLEDRVGALDGHVRCERKDDAVSIHAEIPCAS